LTLRTRGPAKKPSFEEARATLVKRLRERQDEIEQAVLTRTFAVSTSPEPQEADYLEGLRSVVSAAVDYGLRVIEVGEERAPPLPPALFAQTRLAARYGIGLDTVLRRYSAGYVLLSDFLLEETERSGLSGADLQRLMRSQGALDRLLAAVSEEYAREQSERFATSKERRAERIERLLAGEPLDITELSYDLEGHHLGVLATGPGAPEALRSLAASLDRRLLSVRHEEEMIWAWLGGRRPFEAEELITHLRSGRPAGCTLALGEPCKGLAGWRLTHRQAKAALPIALRSPEPFVRYGDVALLTAVLKDELLMTSLRKLYLEPLEVERDGGKVARETLRAYFGVGCNLSSAAAELSVSRQAVAKRLQSIEKALGRPLDACRSEVEIALRIEHLPDLPATF
jgi:diguanylate cyclase with GGDEF domain/PucR-like helix-turn-helix protein